MKTDFTFHYHTDTTDLICQAHREGDDIELDHVWIRSGDGFTDILTILEYEEQLFKSWLLEKIYEKGREEKSELHRESLMA